MIARPVSEIVGDYLQTGKHTGVNQNPNKATIRCFLNVDCMKQVHCHCSHTVSIYDYMLAA